MEKTIRSKRLKRVADFVPAGARLADIGSDHAYLPLFLVESGKISFGIAGEVVQGPYQSAVKNVEEAGQSSQIVVRLADGLAAIESADRVTVVTIAGMGGRLIADILEKGQERLKGVERLILQPNNREEEVRDWLQAHQFRLVAEDLLLENGKRYEVLVAERGQMELTEKERRFGPYLLANRSLIFQEKWQQEQQKLSQALQQIPADHVKERALLGEKIQMIEEVLHVSQ